MAADLNKHPVDVDQEFVGDHHDTTAIRRVRPSWAPPPTLLTNIRLLVLAACAVALTNARAEEPPELKHLRETCPAGAFPSSLEAIAVRPLLPMPGEAERRRDVGGEPPAEIGALKFGLIHRVVGIFINDGWSMWSAIDFDRRVVINIQSKYGRQLEMDPDLLSDKAPAGTLKRVSNHGSLGPVVELVRVVPISNAELLNAACLANRIVALDQVAKRLRILSIPRRPIADIHGFNIELLVGQAVVGYELGDANRHEHEQLLTLMDTKR